MKVKIGKQGKGFGGLIRYVHHEAASGVRTKNARRIGGNIDATLPLNEQARQFRKIASLRSDIERPVLHFSMSAPSGEKLADEKWVQIANDFLVQMLLGDERQHQWLMTVHPGEFEHIHIVVNRVSLGGQVWDKKNDVYRAIAAAQKIEITHGLTITPAFDKTAPVKTLKSSEIQKSKRTEKTTTRLKVRLAIDAAKQSCKSFDSFILRLRSVGIELLPNGLTGAVSGASFVCDGIVFKGSSLGADYRWAAIASAINYDPAGDAQLIQSLRANAPLRPQELLNPPPWPSSKNERFRIEQDEVDDELNETKKKKKKALDSRLHEALTPLKIIEILGERCREITEFATHTEIFIKDGGAIHDFGNQLSCFGDDNEIVEVVKASLDLAKSKNWKKFKIYGPADFVEIGVLEALRAGFTKDQLKVPFWHRAAFERACSSHEKELKNVTSQESRDEGARRDGYSAAEEANASNTRTDSKEVGLSQTEEINKSQAVEVKYPTLSQKDTPLGIRLHDDAASNFNSRLHDVTPIATSRRPRVR